MAEFKLCRHCKKNKADKNRKGLCWGCGQNRLIRDQYPSTSKYNPLKALTDAEILAMPPMVDCKPVADESRAG